MQRRTNLLVKDLNPFLTCKLCQGYIIDATTLIECAHTFCKDCILRYFENSKSQCPMCCVVYKKKTVSLKPDYQMQALIYKLVPSLYSKEIQRREEFYRSTGVRAGSSCSDDSVIEKEYNNIMMNENAGMISQYVGYKTRYFSAEDSISLSLEYYQIDLDTTDITDITNSNSNKKNSSGTASKQVTININNNNSTSTSNKNARQQQNDSVKNIDTNRDDLNQIKSIKNNGQLTNNNNSDKNSDSNNDNNTNNDKRYLQCPAGVRVQHLQKFIRMKNGLNEEHRVDIIHKGEVLPFDFSLMDVAYIFNWKMQKPLRFFYRIFIPMKVKPIKIVNTRLSTGGKQLQIVPITATTPNTPLPIQSTVPDQQPLPVAKPSQILIEKEKKIIYPKEETESEREDKERLLANLQLQSKSKALQQAETRKIQQQQQRQQRQQQQLQQQQVVASKSTTPTTTTTSSSSLSYRSSVQCHNDASPSTTVVKDCVFQFEEDDQEEIKRFAEKRDREWALQKKREEELQLKAERQEYNNLQQHYTSKKRKKSKHSKNESKEKKRKLHADKIHAEITNNDKTDLKLKVKITTNGHKHKHHKIESVAPIEKHEVQMSSKEKLLQMRQVRHKHLSGSSGDEKPLIPTIKLPKIFNNVNDETRKSIENPPSSSYYSSSSCSATSPSSSTSSLENDIKKRKDIEFKTFSNTSVMELNKGIVSSPKGPKPSKIEPVIIKSITSIPETITSSSSSGGSPRANVTNNIVKQAAASRSGTPPVKMAKRENATKPPIIHIEKHHIIEKNSQIPFSKTAAAKEQQPQQIQTKIESTSVKQPSLFNNNNNNKSTGKVLPIGSINTNNKSLDRKIASLQQRCTIETKHPVTASTPPPAIPVKRLENGKIEKKVTFMTHDPKTSSSSSSSSSSPYPPGFTVSKIENGVKRKADGTELTDHLHRPSLEITLIPQSSSTTTSSTTPTATMETKPILKRPPPGTIPLKRIKEAMSMKSGISIIPKMSPTAAAVVERHDTIGVLDLSKPNKSADSFLRTNKKMNEAGGPINGFNRLLAASASIRHNNNNHNNSKSVVHGAIENGNKNNNVQLSNLQMLSKVATEQHSNTINNKVSSASSGGVVKSKPQLPNLQTISHNKSSPIPLKNVQTAPVQQQHQRLPPKLNEIQKFRPIHSQNRNIRPNQNQSIRNIPNPSLLINRQQQNQNRLNLSSGTNTPSSTLLTSGGGVNGSGSGNKTPTTSPSVQQKENSTKLQPAVVSTTTAVVSTISTISTNSTTSVTVSTVSSSTTAATTASTASTSTTVQTSVATSAAATINNKVAIEKKEVGT